MCLVLASFVPVANFYTFDGRINSRKSLTLIQIEERAISGLENLYSAKDNPDEFITVGRCAPTSKLVHSTRPLYRSQLSQESPWAS